MEDTERRTGVVERRNDIAVCTIFYGGCRRCDWLVVCVLLTVGVGERVVKSVHLYHAQW